MDISSISNEEFSSAQELLNKIDQLLDAANQMINNPDAVSKEAALEMLNYLATIMGLISVASSMVVDVELISRPPTTK